jgi:DNA-binding SARP family transcriptional activator/DNA-binding beta-propeller fold protein YncE
VEFRILGPLEVVHQGQRVSVGAAKEQALLAVLLLHVGEVVSRERLIDELWGESPPQTAAKAVNVRISQLRKALAANDGDPIATRSGGYALDVNRALLDATTFENLLADAQTHVAAGDLELAGTILRDALSLWRGPALAGIALESTARHEVQRLEELRLAALLDRIDCDLALARHEHVVAELEALVAEHPLRERLRGQYMLALYRSGRQADALRAYQDTRKALVEGLGLGPSPALQRLEKAILNQDPSLEAPVGVVSARGGASIATALDAPTRPITSARRRLRVTSRRAVAVSLGVVIAGTVIGVWISSTGGGRANVPRAIPISPNSVVKLDPISGRPVSDISVGGTPVSLALTRAAVWVVNRSDRTVSRVDGRIGAVRTIGGVTFAYDVAADSHGNVWVSDSRDALVARITTATEGFPVPSGPPETIHVPSRAGALAVGGGYLWVANAALSASGDVVGQATVSRIDLRSHRFVSAIRVRELPVAIAFGYGSAWVLGGYGSTSLSVIRAGSSRPQSLILSLRPYDFPVAVAVGAGSVWVVTEDGTIFRIDPDARRVVAEIRPHSSDLESLGIAVANGSVWVADRSDSSVSEIDGATHRVVRTIRLGGIGVVPCGVAATASAVWVTTAGDTDCGSSATR